MTGFRPLDQFPVFLDRLGLPASGGRLDFFETGTTTPKDVYGDPDLTVNNGSTVLIGPDGRTVKDIWGDGVYRMRLYAADNTLIAEADTVQIPGGSGTTIPSLQAGKVLTNDGSSLLWDTFRQVPDPAGQGAKILGTDGASLFWQKVADQFQPVIASGSIQLGTILIQWGGDTIAPTGTTVGNKTFYYPRAFASIPVVVGCISTGSGVGRGGGIPSFGITGVTPEAAYAAVDFNAIGPNAIVQNPCPFSWVAIGTAPA